MVMSMWHQGSWISVCCVVRDAARNTTALARSKATQKVAMLELKPNADAQALFEKLTGKSPPTQSFDVKEHLERWSSGSGLPLSANTPQQAPGSGPTSTAASPALH